MNDHKNKEMTKLIYSLLRKATGYDLTNEVTVEFINDNKYLIRIDGKRGNPFYHSFDFHTINVFMRLLKMQFGRYTAYENGVFVLYKDKPRFVKETIYNEESFFSPKAILEDAEKDLVLLTRKIDRLKKRISSGNIKYIRK